MKKIKNYLRYLLKFVKSQNKCKLIESVYCRVKEYGVLKGVRSFLHDKIYLDSLAQFKINELSTAEKYDQWFHKTQLISRKQFSKHAADSIEFNLEISLILVLHDFDSLLFINTISSLNNQSCNKWKLLIFCRTKFILDQAKDSLIQTDNIVILLTYNSSELLLGNILAKVDTSYFIFIEQGDELNSDAIYQFMCLINDGYEIIYPDQDCINLDKLHFAPFFKPNYSLEMIRSWNYFGFGTVVKTALVDVHLIMTSLHELYIQVSRLRSKAYHLDRILYHRLKSYSTEVKKPSRIFHNLIERLEPYSSATNLERVKDISLSQNAQLKFLNFKMNDYGLSVIILNLDHPEYIIPLINQLMLQQQEFIKNGIGFEVIIGDTGSTDSAVLDFYKQCANKIQVISGLKYNFSKNNNDLARNYAKFSHLLFLNNDIVLHGVDTLLKMFNYMNLHPKVGVVGSVLLFANKKVQHRGIKFFSKTEIRGLPYHQGYKEFLPLDQHYPMEFDAVTGACLMVPLEVFYKVGGMDEGYNKECQDVALCLSVKRLGYLVHVLNYGEILHLENGTRTVGEEDWKDRQRFLRKFGSYIESCIL